MDASHACVQTPFARTPVASDRMKMSDSPQSATTGDSLCQKKTLLIFSQARIDRIGPGDFT